MAVKTECLTPGCIFHTLIHSEGWSLTIDFPESLTLSEEQAELATVLLHNQVELVLSFFQEQMENSGLVNEEIEEAEDSTRSLNYH